MRSAREPVASLKRAPDSNMPTSRGGYPSPVTFAYSNGYGYIGVPPIVSRIVIANGQLPTDSFGAVAGINLPRLRVSLAASL